jgi:hypothetical protein
MTPNKKKFYLNIAIVAIVVLVGFLVFKKTTNHQTKESTNPESQQNKAGKLTPLPRTPLPDGPAWEGVLKVSDNLKKGNLMLITEQRTIYLFTSRDFSNLLDKQVKVIYQGSLENFTLLDIAAK